MKWVSCCVGLLHTYCRFGRTFASCEAFSTQSADTYTCMHNHTHTWQKHSIVNCSDKVRIVTVRMYGCECVCARVWVHVMRIRCGRCTSARVWPHNSPQYQGTLDKRSVEFWESRLLPCVPANVILTFSQLWCPPHSLNYVNTTKKKSHMPCWGQLFPMLLSSLHMI